MREIKNKDKLVEVAKKATMNLMMWSTWASGKDIRCILPLYLITMDR